MLLPLVTAQAVSFWIVAPMMVAFALGMVFFRKPVHSAVSLAGMMVGLAILYASLASPFLFVAQIIVYTGAIMMLFLFVIMLVGVDFADANTEVIKGHRTAAILASLCIGLMLVTAVGRGIAGEPIGMDAQVAASGGSVQGMAQLLFSRYVFVFEATEALLTIAAVGAMVLAHGEQIVPKIGQKETAARAMKAYATEGQHPGPRPNSGVFARSNAIHTPALLPDGSIAEESVSKTLSERGAFVDVNELKAPTQATYDAIAKGKAANAGELE